MRTKAGPTLHQNQDDIQSDSENRSHGIRPVLVREEMFQVLFADCGAEAEGGETDKGPGELVGDTDDTI